MKQKLFGNASYLELFLVLAFLTTLGIFALVAGDSGFIAYFTRPLADVTIGEILILMLILWFLKR